jgi:mRNA-degrading endonuclease RelE of RelBE toxin-antitoxin system
MTYVLRSSQYNRQLAKFVKGSKNNAESVKKATKFFVQNPRHPGLNTEKLKGSETWTIRIDKGNRIFFVWIDKTTVLFIDIGEHDKYRKY